MNDNDKKQNRQQIIDELRRVYPDSDESAAEIAREFHTALLERTYFTPHPVDKWPSEMNGTAFWHETAETHLQLAVTWATLVGISREVFLRMAGQVYDEHGDDNVKKERIWRAETLTSDQADMTEEQRDAPPAYECINHVPAKHPPMFPVYWQGRQWAVTEYGIECRNGFYAIAHEYCAYGITGWIKHMSGKAWIDLEDFAEALRIARRQQHRGT
jgi:hypothetical protein